MAVMLHVALLLQVHFGHCHVHLGKSTILHCPSLHDSYIVKCMIFAYLADYHIVADGYGGKGYLVGRENEDQLTSLIKQAQKDAKEGKAALLNVLIGKTNFREGSISV